MAVNFAPSWDALIIKQGDWPTDSKQSICENTKRLHGTLRTDDVQ
jgi:hypothetical protein